VIRALAISPIGLLTFIVALALTAFAVRRGLVGEDAVTLWAGAIGAGGGGVPIGRIIASYPTLPFLGTTALEFITPSGTPTPALLAGGILGLLACLFFRTFRAAGLSLTAAALATLLIALPRCSPPDGSAASSPSLSPSRAWRCSFAPHGRAAPPSRRGSMRWLWAV
jgi:uncharacterized MnhB-related membrane protein